MRTTVLRRLPALLLAITGIAHAADFYGDPNSEAQKWVKAHPSDGRVNDIRDRIANQPAARWFGDWTTDIGTDVAGYVGRATAAGRTPVLVAYNIPDRDCGGEESSGGATSATAYRDWISTFASAVGATRSAVIVLEPDALADLGGTKCASLKATRLSLLAYATAQFKKKSPLSKVYLDIGHSSWLSTTQAADLLGQAGIKDASGFSLNVSNFKTTQTETTYGKAVAAELAKGGFGTKTFVVDTSRNGNGPPPVYEGNWCNPSARKIGVAPSVSPAGESPEMRLWLKNPGLSDGQCGTSSAKAGIFDPELAYKLIHGY
ncbi:glycoside hydrolase family 6 protein [Roseateles chitinivorans]|uniref:glycoside hydrolase family 6 protein n=1 Tax=Roseateles chitinivorans TaxID=2917965 RepID=UPI003D668CC9